MLGEQNNYVVQMIFAAQVESEWRLPLLYQFLQISPTYRLAHDMNQGLRSQGRKLPDDIFTVRSNHSDCGDVWSRPVEEWWYRSARHMFEGVVETAPTLIEQIPAQFITDMSQMNSPNYQVWNDIQVRFGEFWAGDYAKQIFPECAIIGVPLHGDPAEMKKKMCNLIDDAFSNAKQPQQKSVYTFNNSSRIRKLTLEKCLFAVKYKACHTDAPLTDIGDAITDRFKHMKFASENQQQERRNLAYQTSEMLGKALILAEHAARFKFPHFLEPKKKGTSNLKPKQKFMTRFDYEFIASQISAGNIAAP